MSTWAVLVDPQRRALLDELRGGARSVGQLVEALGCSQPTASKHLRVLRTAGLVDVRKDAQRRIYALRLAPIAEIDAWLAPYRRLWNDRLDALGDYLDTEADTAADTEADTEGTSP
ncbi:MAG TPA: metalloregulator ArsR/SmtB family transcription factor [Pseudonocardia sp.]|nr:metalloregulator ArsR/SmtB family transcription factor [Pseudonocardia sp.]